jgi:hypothetical protein
LYKKIKTKIITVHFVRSSSGRTEFSWCEDLDFCQALFIITVFGRHIMDKCGILLSAEMKNNIFKVEALEKQ